MRQGRIFSRRSTLDALRSERGATLLDVVVGSALMTLVFTGIVGAFQLSIDAVSNNKARAGAIALANERLEYIRSLSYNAIGTVGGIPSGAMAQSATTSLNSVTYTRRTFVSWEDDPGDGTGGADSNGIVVDYKAAKVAVSWNSRQGTRTITMATRISPPTGVESAVPGGTIAIQVTNDTDAPVANAMVTIVNAGVTPLVDLTTFTDSMGLASVLGAPAGAGYAVSATKAGYSTSQTYSASATNTNPIPAHLGVALNQTTAANFEIDVLSSVIVETYEAIKEETWTDSFADYFKIATSSAIQTIGGDARLADVEGYPPSGTLISVAPSISYLYAWKEFSWSDTKPAGTGATYRVYDNAYNLISDAELPGNSAGFTVSPVNISALSTTTRALLRLGATLSTSNPSSTPEIHSWNLKYDVGPTPLPNVQFTMQGTKTIGSGPGGPVYKYSAQHSSGAAASVTRSGIEYDSYTLSPVGGTYDISSSCNPQPVTIGPSSSVTTRLYLAPHTANSLLVDVKTPAGALVANASVRLRRGTYDTTISSDQCGQAFFNGISAGSVGSGNPYTIDVSATSFAPYTSSEVNVSGTTRLSVILN